MDELADGRPGEAEVNLNEEAVDELLIDDIDLANPDLAENQDGDGIDGELPTLAAGQMLKASDELEGLVASADEETLEFLIASRTAALWRAAFANEEETVAQARAFSGGHFASEVRNRFLSQHADARNLETPVGYMFTGPDGQLADPNLMQRMVAVRVRDERRLGNWSGTGAGKTLSAILTSRVVGAGLTVITCPNNVIETWVTAIRDAYPDSQVATKTLSPQWDAHGPEHRYLVVNYEHFQQPDSAVEVARLVERESIDMIVVDEIHFTKQRTVENVSQRKQLVQALVVAAGERNRGLCVLGMSATPVINNLHEGRSLVELITGHEHEDLQSRATLGNCMRLHQALMRLGIRWRPRYDIQLQERIVDVDCAEMVDRIRELPSGASPLAIERLLTEARLPAILEELNSNRNRPTLIYTHYIDGIDHLLTHALTGAGYRVGLYTGDDKSGLDAFKRGSVNVLIATSAIATGVDGLQRVCDRLVINALPWTSAEFEQLKGRLWRQGQSSARVDVVIPRTGAGIHGQHWSWCESRLARLRFKASLADAAVDGVVPEGQLKSPAQTAQALRAWLERLAAGDLAQVSRRRIVVPLPDPEDEPARRRRANYGDFSTMNRRWNQTDSAATHERLQDNPEEWQQYHTLYRAARANWSVIPYEHMIDWCRQRSDYVIGDFGCGEALLSHAVRDLHTVHSFDHMAIDDNVTAGDMRQVPLNDGELDVAIFSLSLMGTDIGAYLAEAHRTLKLDGQLQIIEPRSRFSDPDATTFVERLRQLGYRNIELTPLDSRFLKITAIKGGQPVGSHHALTL